MKTALAITLLVATLTLTASADSVVSDTNTTITSVDVGVNEGAGKIFTCHDLDTLSMFYCTDPDPFTCFGVSNCAALGVEVAIDIENGVPINPIAAPEPGAWVLIILGLLAILWHPLAHADFWKRLRNFDREEGFDQPTYR